MNSLAKILILSQVNTFPWNSVNCLLSTKLLLFFLAVTVAREGRGWNEYKLVRKSSSW